MSPELMNALGKAGGVAAIAFAAIGSALGTGAAGPAAIGAWKKCYAANKPAPFQLLVFIGAPLTQTIYGMILMITIAGKCAAPEGTPSWPGMLMAGVIGGMAMGISAWMQGKAGASGADALAETGQGFANYLMTLGVIETVALFVMVFIMALGLN
ncbi:MAG: V-type ATP synthase subunit K [Verrucomicrobia bacterium]|nr:V-type ATP synthase subunit K [Verrucomicrobiota bacterium]MBU1910402.1 V-type ATP synthase subunit K [Verrucomicrobiota bacterium]